MRVNAVAIGEMISDRIIQLCKDVERLACELDTADLVERLQQAPLDAKAASEDVRTPR